MVGFRPHENLTQWGTQAAYPMGDSSRYQTCWEQLRLGAQPLHNLCTASHVQWSRFTLIVNQPEELTPLMKGQQHLRLTLQQQRMHIISKKHFWSTELRWLKDCATEFKRRLYHKAIITSFRVIASLSNTQRQNVMERQRKISWMKGWNRSNQNTKCRILKQWM